MVKEILPLKTAYVPIRPYFELKENPKTFYDKFKPINDGDEFIANSLLKYSRLNATILEANSLGQCLWINNSNSCTGIMKMVMENEIDAGIEISSLNSYQTQNLFPELKLGSFLTDIKKIFMSTPEVEAKNATFCHDLNDHT